jgi:hypothetical protein
MEDYEKHDNSERSDIFSTSVRAGKRTYYFDVKATRKGDFYLTITERKRKYHDDGSFEVEKHKIFLYKEDFEKFKDTLHETVRFIEEKAPEMKPEQGHYSDVSFEDLDR